MTSLITSRTPLRVSFFGGGTDYPEYLARHNGAVVGMTISKYIYISALPLDSFLDYKYRVSYANLETAASIDQIRHPVVREVLRHSGVTDGLDINVISDLPPRNGLGSSSSFTVGLINLLATLQNRRLTKLDLAREATYAERNLLHERVGVQDQFHAAFGGINRFEFQQGRVRISPVQMTADCLSHLTQSLVLLYTGVSRYASEVLADQIAATAEQKIDDELSHLLALTNQAVALLESSDPELMLKDFGQMMHEGWMTKRKLSSKVSNSQIDDVYTRALDNGALGGKLCGAGGGGFLLLVVPPRDQVRLAEAVAPARMIKIDLDTQGSTILYG